MFKLLAYLLNVLAGIVIGLTISLLIISNKVPKAVSENYVPLPSVIENSNVPIITYHYIGYNPNPGKDPMRDELSTSPEQFLRQMESLKEKNYTPINLDELSQIFAKKISGPEKPIVLTFDDGYVDFYINVYPLLRKFNFKATEFIPTNFVGKSNYLTWEMIEEMQKSGLVSFQSHTANHAYLPYLTYFSALKELTDSKSALENHLGTKVNYVAYPFGASNLTIQNAANQAGYLGALGTWNGLTTEINFNMPRMKKLPQ